MLSLKEKQSNSNSEKDFKRLIYIVHQPIDYAYTIVLKIWRMDKY